MDNFADFEWLNVPSHAEFAAAIYLFERPMRLTTGGEHSTVSREIHSTVFDDPLVETFRRRLPSRVLMKSCTIKRD
jgi:hypothetical protein